MSVNKHNIATNASIREIAKSLKQSDVERVEKLRQHFGHIPVTGLEELESKPLEEYENSVRERISNLFNFNKEL